MGPDGGERRCFYREPRFDGPAVEVIGRFGTALEGLLDRPAADLDAPPAGELTTLAGSLHGPLAAAVRRIAGHGARVVRVAAVDDADPVAQVALANALTDSGFVAAAEAHAALPRAREGRFDLVAGGSILGVLLGVSDKLSQGGEQLEANRRPPAGAYLPDVVKKR